MIGIVWDFDGVLVFTPHEKAWKIATERYGGNLTHEFFVKYVSGKPRYEGARNILEGLGIYEKMGANTVEERERILREFAELKNKIVNEMFDRGEYEVNWEAIQFLLDIKDRGVKNALASASKNATKLARRIRIGKGTLLDLFDINVSGKASSKKEVFKLAIKELKEKFNVEKVFVIEDAPAGIEAAKELGAITLGYEKDWKLDADITFSSFSELSLEKLLEVTKNDIHSRI